MRIEILGSGCPSCHRLFELTRQAARELGIEEEVTYSDDIQRIIAMGVMQVPVLAIDGEPVMTGATDDMGRIKAIISNQSDPDGPATGEGGCACRGRC